MPKKVKVERNYFLGRTEAQILKLISKGNVLVNGEITNGQAYEEEEVRNKLRKDSIKKQMLTLKEKNLIEILDNVDYPLIHGLQITDLGLKVLMLAKTIRF